MNKEYETCKKYEIKCPYSNLNGKCIGVGGECNNYSILHYKKEKIIGKEQIGNEKFSEKISNLEKTIKWIPEFLKN